MPAHSEFLQFAAISLAVAYWLGCKSRITMPINQSSHLQIQATPFNSEQVELSYHWYESTAAAPEPTEGWSDWKTEIELKGLGTVYASDQSNSPAAQRLESSWETLWEEGALNWSSIDRLIQERPDLPQKILPPDSLEPYLVHSEAVFSPLPEIAPFRLE